MIKDQEALARWTAQRAQINRARAIMRGSQIDQARLARLDQAKSPSADWIASHRPMRSTGQSWEASGARYAPQEAPKIIHAR